AARWQQRAVAGADGLPDPDRGPRQRCGAGRGGPGDGRAEEPGGLMGLRSNGLWLEVVGREISGRPVPGKPRRPSGPYLLGLPALLLSCLLLVPIAVTVVAAFTRPDGSFGLGNFAVMGDPAALHAVGNSLAWIAVALGLV